MNETEEALRRRVAENLRLAEQLSQRVGRIRDLFEERLKEHPLYYWNPSIRNLRRQELWGYGIGELEGEFEFVALPQQGQFMPSTPEVCRGDYDLTVFIDGTSLRNGRIEVHGTVGGYGPIDYVLPPVEDIKGKDQAELKNLLVEIDSLESLLKLIGLLSDWEVDSEEDSGRVIHLRSPRNPREIIDKPSGPGCLQI